MCFIYWPELGWTNNNDKKKKQKKKNKKKKKTKADITFLQNNGPWLTSECDFA